MINAILVLGGTKPSGSLTNLYFKKKKKVGTGYHKLNLPLWLTLPPFIPNSRWVSVAGGRSSSYSILLHCQISPGVLDYNFNLWTKVFHLFEIYFLNKNHYVDWQNVEPFYFFFFYIFYDSLFFLPHQ